MLNTSVRVQNGCVWWALADINEGSLLTGCVTIRFEVRLFYVVARIDTDTIRECVL